MRWVFLLIFFSVLFSFPSYIEKCSECGSTINCSYKTYEKSCLIHSVSLICRTEKTLTGFLFCPTCPEGYKLKSCTNDWFGLIKNAICYKDRITDCGEVCNSNENAVDFNNCFKPSFKTCCKIPNNKVEIISPKNNSYLNISEPFNLTIAYYGLVKTIDINFGNNLVKRFYPSISPLIINYSYKYMGIYHIKVIAKYDNITSTDTLILNVGYRS